MPAEVAVAAIQLPGRERLLRHRPLRRMTAATRLVADAIARALRGPYVLFGHSMGALLAYEVAKRLHRRGFGAPEQLFVAGCRAPDVAPDTALAHLPDDLFLEEVRRLGGTPPAAFDSEELARLVLPALRADFEICETYHGEADAPLPCAISTYAATRDPLAPLDAMLGWERYTCGGFAIDMVEGDHFFPHDDRTQMPELLAEQLLGARLHVA